jgi:NAD(P)H-flavin reductase
MAVVVIVGSALRVVRPNHLLTDAAIRGCLIVTAVLIAAVLVDRRIRRPRSVLRTAFVVEQVRWEAPGISTLVLIPARPGHPGMQFRPGQFAWIRLDSPRAAAQPYRFVIAPGAIPTPRLEFTIRHAGEFSPELSALSRGRRVFLDGPHGSCSDDPHRPAGMLLIAASAGMTTMIRILRTQAARGDRRPHCLIVAARTEAELIFRDELRELGAHLDLELVEVVSAPTAAWRGMTGHVDLDLLETVLGMRRERPTAHAYLCGPTPVVAQAHAALLTIGIPAQRINAEQFDLV